MILPPLKAHTPYAANAVIVKPSTDNPLTLCRLTHLMDEAGVTKGAISIVTGRGPVVPIIAFDTEEEAIEIANRSIFGLCGCVFTGNMKTAARVANALECGGAVINGTNFFRSFKMLFGGYKHSGIGTEGVLSTFNEMTHTKSIVRDILPPLTLSLRSGGFLFDSPDGLSISRLSPRAPRFFLIP